MDLPVLNTLSLCSGSGMLDEGLRAGCECLGIKARVQAYVEWEAYAATTLLVRMEDESLEPAPIFLGDLADFPTADFRGLVDLVCAGFPCPPVSSAGQRRGVDDERWLWPQIERVVCEVGAAGVFLENVRGLLSANSGREFGEVLAGLARLGMHVEWLTLRAADVGASHERERVFILAWRPGGLGFAEKHGRERRRLHEPAGRIGNADAIRSVEAMDDAAGGQLQLGQRKLKTAGAGGESGVERSSQELAHHGRPRDYALEHESLSERGEAAGLSEGELELADSDGLGRRGQGDTCGTSGEPDDGGKNLADAEQPALQRRGPSEPGGWPFFAPGPQDPRWGDILSECPWLAPALESGFHMLVDGQPMVLDASRADQLRCAGNGVVALQAALAFVVLVERGEA